MKLLEEKGDSYTHVHRELRIRRFEGRLHVVRDKMISQQVDVYDKQALVAVGIIDLADS